MSCRISGSVGKLVWKEQGAVLRSYQVFLVFRVYTKGVETQLAKLRFLAKFDEILKLFETKSLTYQIQV